MADQIKGGRGGLRLGKYQVIEHIATGGMGAVYKALDVENNRPVALKILSHELAKKRANLERFRREAQSAGKLRHDNIVSIYEVGEANGTHFLAMEFVDGIDLHEYINDHGPLTPDQARQVLLQAARALDHAHRQGVVHRDIKPSNFLIVDQGGQLVAKLTDFGLARETQQEQARVTRLGTTVGTVDYMAPEQARNSGLADIRSDLYSLGCTLYHMLSGGAPFPEGSVTERVFKHVEVQVPDIRQVNPDVPESLAAILQKLLQKKPEDRFQTPLELLRDLESPEDRESPVGEAEGLSRLGDLAQEDAPEGTGPTERPERTADSRSDEVVIPPTGARRPRDRADRAEPAGTSTIRWPAILIALLALAAIGVGIWSQMGSEDKRRTDKGPPREAPVVQSPAPVPPEEKDTEKEKEPTDQTLPRKEREKQPLEAKLPPQKKLEIPSPIVDAKPVDRKLGPEAPEYPALFKPLTPLNRAGLWQEFAEPFKAFPEPPADAPVYRVGRTLPDGGSSFQTLGEALEQRRGDQPIVIEIHDQGPLFSGSLPEIGRGRVWLRAGAGYRPVLAWDPSPEASQLADKVPAAPRFMSLVESQLVLEDLDVVTKWSEPAGAESPALFSLQASDLHARRCTFSLAGKHPAGLSAARLTARRGDRAPSRTRLSRCSVRGGDATAVNVSGCPAEVLLERCLIVGTDKPLLRLRPGDYEPARVRLIRSTLVAGRTAIEAAPPGVSGSVSCHCWDTLLARSDPRGDGAMIHVPRGADLAGFDWRALNCVFAGWRALLTSGGKGFAAHDLDEWSLRWANQEGIRALDDPFPPSPPFEPEELPSNLFSTERSALSFAATSGTGRLGCELGAIPSGPLGWQRRTFDRYAVAAPALAEPDAPPIPASADGLYHGERVDLAQTNLEELLKSRAQSARPAPRVVLHLSGKGVHVLGPLRVRGYKHLVLYFEPPEDEKSPRLTLVPDEGNADHDALIDVRGGIVEVIGARIQFKNDKSASMPRNMFRVQNGELRLAGCALQGPLTQPPPTFQGLILCPETKDAKQAGRVSIHESLLLASPRLLTIRGEARLRIKQSMLVGPGGILHLDLGSRPEDRTPFFALFERNTIAIHGPLVKVSEVTESRPREPAVLQMHANLFVNPFLESAGQPCLLQCPADVVARGELLWQGRGNGFDARRIPRFADLEDDDDTRFHSLARWRRLWGHVGERNAVLVDVPASANKVFRAETPRLDRLALPPGVRPVAGEPPPGADLTRLGAVMRKFN